MSSMKKPTSRARGPIALRRRSGSRPMNNGLSKRTIHSKPARKSPTKVPDYFTATLNKNPKARKTFENFSPSNQREYVEWVSEAKRDQTREQRLKTSISWLAEGKPRNWKYMPAWQGAMQQRRTAIASSIPKWSDR